MDHAKTDAKASRSIQRDVNSLEASTVVLDKDADRRTALAADRTLLAAERTYAAWVRTGLAALASGIGARAILKDAMPMLLVRVTATVLILFAGFCMCAAIWREFYSLPPPGKTRLNMMPRYVIIPVNGFLILVTLAALVGVWIK